MCIGSPAISLMLSVRDLSSKMSANSARTESSVSDALLPDMAVKAVAVSEFVLITWGKFVGSTCRRTRSFQLSSISSFRDEVAKQLTNAQRPSWETFRVTEPSHSIAVPFAALMDSAPDLSK